MGRMIASVLVMGLLAGCYASPRAPAIGLTGRAEVSGVEEGDMLKLRAGPGLGRDQGGRAFGWQWHQKMESSIFLQKVEFGPKMVEFGGNG